MRAQAGRWSHRRRRRPCRRRRPSNHSRFEAGPAPEAAAPLPRLDTLLDVDRGRRALTDYRAALARLCAALGRDGGGGAARLKSLGLDGAEPEALCANVGTAGEALASGAFAKVGADEVLLDVPSGMDRAAGDHALALMRRDGPTYQVVAPVVLGNDRFEARARVVTASGRDLLMVCNPHGQQGVYPSTCGFFGGGSFGRATPKGTALRDELQLVDVTVCGPGASVRLGAVTLEGSRLHAHLVVETFILEREGSARGDDDACGRRVTRARHEFDIAYELEGDRFRRMTPVPKDVLDVLRQY